MAEFYTTTTAPEHKVLIRGEQQLVAIRNYTITNSAEFSNSGGDGRQIMSVISFLESSAVGVQAMIDTPAISQIAKNINNDQSYDIITAATSLIDKINVVVSDLLELIPKSGPYVLLFTVSGTDLVPRQFTASQLSPLIIKLDEIAAMIP
tara:strand:- start:1481 stop:1930 length:450 start_codon:yes stop_codon:yes gene_type:complete